MNARSVSTTMPVDDTRVHRFQVVREYLADGAHEDWIVVGFTPDGVELASVGFDWFRTISATALAGGSFEPLAEGGVPVWGY